MPSTWKFGATNNLTPSLNIPNISLETASSEYAEILEFFWGGEVTTSQQMRTGVFRMTEATGGTNVNASRFAEQQTSPRALCLVPSYGTPPEPDTGIQPFFQTAWNAHGGVIRWLAAPGEEIVLLGVSTVGIENQTGVVQSSYGMIWGEL